MLLQKNLIGFGNLDIQVQNSLSTKTTKQKTGSKKKVNIFILFV